MKCNINKFNSDTSQHLADIIFEFMLNALRLFEPVSFEMFEARTGLNREILQTPFKLAIQKGLLKNKPFIETTDLGKKYLNDLCRIFIKNR